MGLESSVDLTGLGLVHTLLDAPHLPLRRSDLIHALLIYVYTVYTLQLLWQSCSYFQLDPFHWLGSYFTIVTGMWRYTVSPHYMSDISNPNRGCLFFCNVGLWSLQNPQILCYHSPPSSTNTAFDLAPNSPVDSMIPGDSRATGRLRRWGVRFRSVLCRLRRCRKRLVGLNETWASPWAPTTWPRASLEPRCTQLATLTTSSCWFPIPTGSSPLACSAFARKTRKRFSLKFVCFFFSLFFFPLYNFCPE